jgi:hypothetical protein
VNVTRGDSRLDLGMGGRDSIAGTAGGLDHGDGRAAGRDSIAGRGSRGQLRPGVVRSRAAAHSHDTTAARSDPSSSPIQVRRQRARSEPDDGGRR